MAPKHKAPTQVQIFTSEKSALGQWLDRNWRTAALAAGIVTAGILVNQYQAKQRRQAQIERWNKLTAAQTSGEPEELEQVAEELAGTPIASLALLSSTQILVSEREYDAALEAVQRLRQASGDFWTKPVFPLGEAGAEVAIVDSLESAIRSQKAQDEALASIFQNPAPAADAPRVRLATSMGDIVVALYPDQAPKHVENFLKLADEHYYDGVKFHRVIDGFMIQTGDPNTKDAGSDRSTWGQGGPGYKVPAERNELVHAPYVLAAAKQAQESESSGSQFYITVGSAHHLDKEHTVFGVVESGKDVADAIAKVPLEKPEHPSLPVSTPRDPPVLERVERVTP